MGKKVIEKRCPYCAGIKTLIDRFDHSIFYDCPLCKGKGTITLEVNIMTDSTLMHDKRTQHYWHLIKEKAVELLHYCKEYVMILLGQR